MTAQTLNAEYARVASEEQIQQALEALNAGNIQAVVVDTGEQACEYVLNQLPEGSEVHSSSSRTLDQIGLTAVIEESGRYNAVRPQLRKMDRATQSREIRKLGASPDFMLGSVHAVTLSGQVIVGSGSGSQMGAYTSGAGKVIWVVGAQKIVATLEDGMRRLREYCLPAESERLMAAIGRPSRLNQILILQSAWPGRLQMVIVRENIGV
jgi:hypothetical protein